jgi:hypothetical protein
MTTRTEIWKNLDDFIRCFEFIALGLMARLGSRLAATSRTILFGSIEISRRRKGGIG